MVEFLERYKTVIIFIIIMLFVSGLIFFTNFYVKKPICYGKNDGEDLYAVKVNGNYSYVNEEGQVRIKTFYNNIKPFDEAGVAIVESKRGMALIDRSCNVLTDYKNEYIRSFSFPGYYKGKNKGKEYILNHKGKELYKADTFMVSYKSNQIIAYSYEDGKYKKGLYEYKNDELVEVLEPNYDQVGFVYEPDEVGIQSYYKLGDQVGYVFHDGRELVVDDVFEGFEGFIQGVSLVQKNDKWALLHKSGNFLTDFDYNVEGNFIGDVYFNETIKLKKENKWGLLNTEGEILLDFVYDDIMVIKDYMSNDTGDFSYYTAVKRNNKWAYLDEEFNFITGFEYDEIRRYKDGFAGVKKDGYWTFIDQTGTEVTDFVYEYVWLFHNNYALVKREGKYGYINTLGIEIIKPVYNELYTDAWYRNNDANDIASRIAVRQGDKWGYIDQNGNDITGIKYDVMRAPYTVNNNHPEKSHYVAVTEDDQNTWGVINIITGEQVIDYTDEWIEYYLGDGKFELTCLADKPQDAENCESGKRIVDIGDLHDYDFVRRIGNVNDVDYYLYKNNFDQVGVMTENYDPIIDAAYKYIDRYYVDHQYAYYAIKDNEYYVMNDQGEIIATEPYEELALYNGEITGIKQNNKWGVIDREGRFIVSPEYDDLGSVEDQYYRERKEDVVRLIVFHGYVKVKLKNHWGLININTGGELILNTEYEEIEVVNGLDTIYIKAKVNDKWGLFDSDGNQLLDCKYEGIILS